MELSATATAAAADAGPVCPDAAAACKAARLRAIGPSEAPLLELLLALSLTKTDDSAGFRLQGPSFKESSVIKSSGKMARAFFTTVTPSPSCPVPEELAAGVFGLLLAQGPSPRNPSTRSDCVWLSQRNTSGSSFEPGSSLLAVGRSTRAQSATFNLLSCNVYRVSWKCPRQKRWRRATTQENNNNNPNREGER